MPFTRQQSKDIFNHLVTNVAFLEDVDPGFLALMQEGITNLSMLLSLDASDVLTWYYPFADDAGTVTNKPLPKGQQYLLKHLVNFTQMHYTSTPSAQDSLDFPPQWSFHGLHGSTSHTSHFSSSYSTSF